MLEQCFAEKMQLNGEPIDLFCNLYFLFTTQYHPFNTHVQRIEYGFYKENLKTIQTSIEIQVNWGLLSIVR